MEPLKVTADLIEEREVEFLYYRDGSLWYKLPTLTETFFGGSFIFPVPITDAGTATFKAKDKAIYFMRWIRKHMVELEQEKQEALSTK